MATIYDSVGIMNSVYRLSETQIEFGNAIQEGCSKIANELAALNSGIQVGIAAMAQVAAQAPQTQRPVGIIEKGISGANGVMELMENVGNIEKTWGNIKSGAEKAIGAVKSVDLATIGYNISQGAMAVGSKIAAGAQWLMNSALFACPITWIVLGIIALVAIIYGVVAAINHFAGTSYSASGIIIGAFMTVAAFVGNLFISVINMLISNVSNIWNLIASFAEFFANVFSDPVGSVGRLFMDLADSVLGMLQTMATGIDTLFGTQLSDKVQGWRNDLSAFSDNKFGKPKIEIPRMNAAALQIDRFEYGKAYNAGYAFGDGLGKDKNALPNMDTSGIMASANGGDEIKNINSDVKIDMTNNMQITKEADADLVISRLTNKLYESLQVSAEGVHA